jgi:hypothetical protein
MINMIDTFAWNADDADNADLHGFLNLRSSALSASSAFYSLFRPCVRTGRCNLQEGIRAFGRVAATCSMNFGMIEYINYVLIE